MRRSLAGPGTSKYVTQKTQIIDPGVVAAGSYIKKEDKLRTINLTGADLLTNK